MSLSRAPGSRPISANRVVRPTRVMIAEWPARRPDHLPSGLGRPGPRPRAVTEPGTLQPGTAGRARQPRLRDTTGASGPQRLHHQLLPQRALSLHRSMVPSPDQQVRPDHSALQAPGIPKAPRALIEVILLSAAAPGRRAVRAAESDLRHRQVIRTVLTARVATAAVSCPMPPAIADADDGTVLSEGRRLSCWAVSDSKRVGFTEWV